MNLWPQLNNGEMTVLVFVTFVVLVLWIYNTKDPRKQNKKRSNYGVQ